MIDEMRPQNAKPLCQRCGTEPATRGLKYCRECTRSVIYQMRADGYLCRLPKRPAGYRSAADRDEAAGRRYGVDWWREESWTRAIRKAPAKEPIVDRPGETPEVKARKAKILALLTHRAMRVGEVAESLDLQVSSVSTYLAWLSHHGAVERDTGKWPRRYRTTTDGREMFRQWEKTKERAKS